MTTESPLRTLLGTLLDAHRSAFDLREHATAFHALSAACHAAESLEDLEALSGIHRLALDELAWIDAHDPENRLSTRVAEQRHRQSIFVQLATTAHGMRQRIEADRRIQMIHRDRRN
ncbi:MAG TPA: hypothetical protein VFQ39_18915 [Longimicrobium sp.]|nr:hypothetical protein [Longimicrobium sp.]